VKQREKKEVAGRGSLCARRVYFIMWLAETRDQERAVSGAKSSHKPRGETENFLMPLSNKTLMRCKFFVFLNFKSDSAPDEALVSFREKMII
jgi:hypothetical protein